MKKIILFAVILFSLAACFADEFKGFLGIPFGSTKKTCLEKMVDMGWIWRDDLSEYDTLVFVGRKYAGKETTMSVMKFTVGLSMVYVTFKNESDTKEVFDVMKKKYNLSEQEGMYYTNNAIFSFLGEDSIAILDRPKNSYESTMDSDL